MTIKVVTYNILFSRHAKDITENVAILAEDGATVFCLQEVLKTEGESFIIDEILQRLGKDWKAIYHLGNDGSISDFGCGIIWDSKRLQLESVERIFLPKLNRLAPHEFLVDKLTGHKGLPVQRRAISGVFTYQNKPIAITSLHLDNAGGASNRMKQLQHILKILRKKSVAHQIICGDFNTLDLLKTGKEYQKIKKVFGDTFTDASKNIAWTADLYDTDTPKHFPYFIALTKTIHLHIRRKLDYIWVKNFEVQECKKLERKGSDHQPILVKIKLL